MTRTDVWGNTPVERAEHLLNSRKKNDDPLRLSDKHYLLTLVKRIADKKAMKSSELSLFSKKKSPRLKKLPLPVSEEKELEEPVPKPSLG